MNRQRRTALQHGASLAGLMLSLGLMPGVARAQAGGFNRAAFDLSDSIEANVATRVKMGQTSNVYAVAITADNKVLFAQKEVKVTLGGCGG